MNLPPRRVTLSEIEHTREEVWNFINDEPPFEQMTFVVTRLYKFCVENNWPLVRVPISRDIANFCLTNRGVEVHRLLRLTREDLNKPLLFIKYDGRGRGTHLMVDGTHRLVRLVLMGMTETLAYVIEDRAIWDLFVVNGMPELNPEKLLTKASGL